MGGPGQTDQGAIQRAKLFADVEELMEWKKGFDHKQREMLHWQKGVIEQLMELKEELTNTLRGCNVLVDCDTQLGNRIDIVNKRLRHLEEAVGRLTPR